MAVRRRLRRRYQALEEFDCRCLIDGASVLAGTDEAGRGALAGPVVAAAVVLPRDSELVGVDDSKTLAEEEREALFSVIVSHAIAVGIAISHPHEIDRRNVLNASLEAMARAVTNLRMSADVILVDGRDRIDMTGGRVVPVIGGDGKSLSIAAASVVAKVARDRLMRRMHVAHPAYNFVSNKGYGTKDHIDAIVRHGMAPIHRRTYCAAVVENRPSLF